MTFALLYAALYARMVRANVMEALGEDYVRTARAKGAPEWLVMRSHVLRNALLPVVTMLGMDIGLALGGAIFTETVYGLPGLGKTAVQAIGNFDLPTTQGVLGFAPTSMGLPTGRSALGQLPYSQLAAPPRPEPLDMEAALAGGSFTEVMTDA